jgi:hypothetical protein
VVTVSSKRVNNVKEVISTEQHVVAMDTIQEISPVVPHVLFGRQTVATPQMEAADEAEVEVVVEVEVDE